MAIVNTTVPITSDENRKTIETLAKTYPDIRVETLAFTAFGRPVVAAELGSGPRKVLFSASHHANEWITTLVLLQFLEDLAKAAAEGGSLLGEDARQLLEETTVYLVPMVDPDGVDLVVGAIDSGSDQYRQARRLADNYPAIPFPSGWKANLEGVDLNLQYPAGWLQAREIKFSQGFTRPGPRDYVGRAPLNQPESRAMAAYTQAVDPDLVLAYHTQGQEIYWEFNDIFVPGARELGEIFAQVSGYTLATVAESSGYAGYKDWFIQQYRRPGYTIEAGKGENPLSITQFPQIYRENLPILVAAMVGRTPNVL